MGLGITPTDYHSNNTAVFQLKDGNAIFSRTGGTFLGMFQNIKYNSSDVTQYITSNPGSAYFQTSGVHKFFTAASGTADNNATLDERLRIEADGDIGLLTQTPNLSGYGEPTTSIGKSSNPYSVLELQGNQTSDGAMGVIVGYNSAGSSRIATINMSRKDANNSGAITFDTASSGSLGTRVTISNDGLLFGSDTAAANALDDYEEGFFTAANDHNTIWYSNQNECSYTKIGRQVTVTGQIRAYSGSGALRLSLPFTPATSPTGESEFNGAGTLAMYSQSVVNASDGDTVVVIIGGGQSFAEFVETHDNAAWSALQTTANAYLRFTFTYFAA